MKIKTLLTTKLKKKTEKTLLTTGEKRKMSTISTYLKVQTHHSKHNWFEHSDFTTAL